MSVAWIISNGADGGTPDSPPKAWGPPEAQHGQDANCNWIDDDCAQVGFPGGPGNAGAWGAGGGWGGNAGSIHFETEELNGAVKFQARGGNGGAGAKGGDGGDGGKGGKGGNGDDC